MKKLAAFLFCICLLQAAMAQVPNQFNYQAVARNSAGQSIANANIRVRFTILDGSATGTNVYSEVRLLTTNQLGLFTAPIGGTSATSVTGNFAIINWATGKKFIKVEADPLGGTSYILLGNTEMLSVPYALYAVNGKVGPAGPQGLPGKNTLIQTTAEPAGANCIAGGIKQVYGLDANSNGILEAGEINQALTKYVCNGITPATNNFWNINGNAGNTDTNFIGTVDVQPLKFRINNSTAGEINGANNTTLGYFSGAAMVSNSSTGIGAFSLANTTGFHNTGLGYSSLYSNGNGFSNVAIGTSALYKNLTRGNLVAIGDSALFNNDFDGSAADPSDATKNTAVGSKALYTNTSGSSNTAVGYQALFSNEYAVQNTAIGAKALYSNTTGVLNTASGTFALYNNTTGERNTANGGYALFSNTTGKFNTSNGTEALYNNTTGNDNVANGVGALAANTTGYNNAANGSRALSLNITGQGNTANGYKALSLNTTGSFNAANGELALYNNSTGNYNVANGEAALYSNTTGNNNVANGFWALFSNTTGNNNVASGSYALRYTTGNQNIGIGYNAGYFSSATGDNQISIGNNSGYPASNAAIIGNSSQTWIGGQVGWSSLSDGRVKENVQENEPGLAFIKLLRPVTYNINIRKQQELIDKMIVNDPSVIKDSLFMQRKLQASAHDWKSKYEIEKITQTGFVAQEVEEAVRLANFNFSGVDIPKPGDNKLYSIRYTDFIMPLVKGMQEQQIQIESLQKQIAELEKIINVLVNN